MNQTYFPPAGFLPDYVPGDCPFCEAENNMPKPAPAARVPVKVVSINGVPQKAGTVLLMRPVALKKIEEQFNQYKDKL